MTGSDDDAPLLPLATSERAELEELRRLQPGLWLRRVDRDHLVLAGRLSLFNVDDVELDAYQRRLLAFLGVASFFEGYDFIALTQILPNFRASMHVGKDTVGAIVALINVGSVVAYFVLASRSSTAGVFTRLT